MINQPQEDIALPENLKKAIEKSKNIVTINEAEALRLKSLIVSSEYTVSQLHNQEVELNEKIERLSGTLDILEAQNKDAENKLELKKEEINVLEDKYISIKKNIDKDIDLLSEETKYIKEEKDYIEKKISELEEIEKDIKNREEVIKTKEDKLKEYFK